jgi:cellulose biosynthesis protein BcsQ
MIRDAAPPAAVLLSAIGQEEMNSAYTVFLSETSKVRIVSMATDVETLKRNLISVPCEVAVIDAELLTGLGADEMLNFLSTGLGQAVAVVLLPPALGHLTGKLRELGSVRDAFVKPVNHSALVQRIYEIAITERAGRQSISAADVAVHSGRSTFGVAGLRTFAFYSDKGGGGKTTLAINFWYRLNQSGIRALLMGFDVPDDLGPRLGLEREPNSSYFYLRPGREAFKAALQQKDGFDVLLSPNDHEVADEVEQKRLAGQDLIPLLIDTAREHNPPYAAIVMDLPPVQSIWSTLPLVKANTIVLVMQPDKCDVVKLIYSMRLFAGRFADRYRIDKSTVFGVLNMRTDEDNITARDIQESAAPHLDGWTIPIIATVPFDAQVRPLQNRGVLPVARLDGFAAGIDDMVNFFYSEVIGTRQKTRRAGRGLLKKLGISLEVR